MGKKNNTPNPTQQAQNTYNSSVTAYQNTTQPTATEGQVGGLAGQMAGNYSGAVAQNQADYGNIMGSYQNYLKNFNPKAQMVSYNRPDELNEGFGYMREAMPGYRNFANTGGYSDQDIQELRARSTNPVRAAYGNTMMQLDRARALGGDAGAPNYIAALSRANRELPGQVADAQTNINAALADQIRQGKLAGLAGMTGIGQSMGGMSLDDARLGLTAATANQDADLQAQGLGNSGRLAAMSGMNSLYGTTPGMSNMFGNQALQGYNQLGSLENARNNYGLGLLNNQLEASRTQQAVKGTPLWKKLLGTAAGAAATYFTGGLAAPLAGKYVSRLWAGPDAGQMAESGGDYA